MKSKKFRLLFLLLFSILQSCTNSNDLVYEFVDQVHLLDSKGLADPLDFVGEAMNMEMDWCATDYCYKSEINDTTYNLSLNEKLQDSTFRFLSLHIIPGPNLDVRTQLFIRKLGQPTGYNRFEEPLWDIPNGTLSLGKNYSTVEFYLEPLQNMGESKAISKMPTMQEIDDFAKSNGLYESSRSGQVDHSFGYKKKEYTDFNYRGLTSLNLNYNFYYSPQMDNSSEILHYLEMVVPVTGEKFDYEVLEENLSQLIPDYSQLIGDKLKTIDLGLNFESDLDTLNPYSHADNPKKNVIVSGNFVVMTKSMGVFGTSVSIWRRSSYIEEFGYRPNPDDFR